ncbi:O-antigen translocase [Cronobacter turicensis]|nr:O-antigen translocase [Cronobacter turicensis]ELY4575391.1 O-antigen translocase [Cronobacter turicensis]
MKRLLTITSMTAALTLFRMMSGFIVVKFVAIYAGATGLALLGQFQSLILILNGIVNAPAGNAVVKYTAQYSHINYSACAPWWRASMRWIVILIAITLTAGLLLSHNISAWVFQTEDYWWVIQVALLFLPFSAVASLINSVINGQQNYRRYIFLGATSVLISSFLMIMLVMNYGLTGALLAASLQSSAIGIVLLLSSVRQPWLKIQFWWGRIGKKHKTKITGYLMMTIVSAVMMPLSLIGVRNIIAYELNWDAVGQWQVVWKISEVYLSVITIALGTYYLPRLAKLNKVDSVIGEINNTLKFVFPFICIAALGIYLFRDLAIRLLFTKDFIFARDLFGIQLCGDVIKVISWVLAYPMIARGATKWFIGTEVFFSLSLVFLTFVFVKFFSLQGANIAYFVNYSIYGLFIRVNLRKIIS